MRIESFLIGTALILTGTVMLLSNLGYGDLNLAVQAGRFWPLILIIIGLAIYWRGRIPRWLALVIVLVLVGAVTAIQLFSPGQAAPGPSLQFLNVRSLDYPGVNRGILSLEFGGGRLNLGSSRDNLMEGRFPGAAAYSKVRRDGAAVRIVLSQANRFWTGRPSAWDLGLSPELLWEVSVRAGAAQADLDLYGIPLRELDLELGAGDVSLNLGDNGEHAAIRIKSGASAVKVRVPGDTGVRINMTGALSSTNLAGRDWLIVDRQYVSPNYEQAESRLDLSVDMAVGSFTLDYPPAFLTEEEQAA